MAEQLICNQQVVGSTPITSSKHKGNFFDKFPLLYGSVPERPKGADCKSVVSDFGGPNPPAPTKKSTCENKSIFLSYTVTSRENIRRIFHLLGEPKTL